MVVAIHQPNFCPWGSFFNKMRECDVFILLNHCTYAKNNFQNRFYYQGKWFTMRCNQSHQCIIDKRYLFPIEDWAKITNSLPVLKVFDECEGVKLPVMNGRIIRKAAQLLNINTKIVDDRDCGLSGTDRLVRLCKDHNADTYLSGVSGHKYLELDKFTQAGIRVIFQESPDKRALVELL